MKPDEQIKLLENAKSTNEIGINNSIALLIGIVVIITTIAATIRLVFSDMVINIVVWTLYFALLFLGIFQSIRTINRNVKEIIKIDIAIYQIVKKTANKKEIDALIGDLYKNLPLKPKPLKLFGMKKGVAFLSKNWQFLLTFIVSTIIVGIISNQIAQPLFNPRLSTFSVSKPLYVQSQDTGDKIAYYKVFKVSYEIEPALFWSTPQHLKVFLPSKFNSIDFAPTESIELISQLREANPYTNIELPRTLTSANFIDTDELKDELNITIYTNGWNVKSFSMDLFFREKTEIETSRKDAAPHRWWSESTISPESIIVVEENRISPILYGVRYDPGDGRRNIAEFQTLIISNKNNMEIREYWVRILDEVRICEGNTELNSRRLDNADYFAIDLAPQQTRKFLLFDVLDPNTNTDASKTFNLTTFWCGELTSKIQQ